MLRAEERGHEVEAAQQVREPVGLQGHDHVERDQREAQRVQRGVDSGQPGDPMRAAGRAASAEPSKPAMHRVVAAAAAPHPPGPGQEKVRHEVGADQRASPPRTAGPSTTASRANMSEVRQPDGLAVRQAGQLLLHVAVDRVIPDGEDEREADQRHRQEGHAPPAAEPDEQPGPLGVGDLVDRGQGDAAPGEPGEEQPVDVERLPGAMAAPSPARADARRARWPDEGEAGRRCGRTRLYLPLTSARRAGRAGRGRASLGPSRERWPAAASACSFRT